MPVGENSTNLETDESECQMPCPGDPTQNCGEEFNIQIFRTGNHYLSLVISYINNNLNFMSYLEHFKSPFIFEFSFYNY